MNRFCLAGLILIWLSTAAFAEDAGDVEKKLAGTWVVEKAVWNSDEIKGMKGAEFTFKDGTLTVKKQNEKEYTITFKIGAVGKEFEIDFISKDPNAEPGGTGLARIDGESLLFATGPGKRPSIIGEDVQGAPTYKLKKKK